MDNGNQNQYLKKDSTDTAKKLVDFVTPDNFLELGLNFVPFGGKLTKAGAFQKFLSKYPRVAKLFKSKPVQKNQGFDFTKNLSTTKNLPSPEIQIRYGKENIEDLFKAVDTESGKFLKTGDEVPTNLTFFGPKKRARTYNNPSLNRYEAYLNPKKPYITDKKEIWTVDRIRGLQKEGYDMIKVKNPYIGELESIPLDKSIINMQSYNIKAKK